jgi:hypothetical protein
MSIMWLQDYAAFVASWRDNFQRFLVVLVVHTNVGNQMAIFYSLLSPNQDIARALMTGVWTRFILASVLSLPYARQAT